jgi:hypothetical protein
MQRKNESERKILIERYRESGLSVRAFCSNECLAEQTLRNWIGEAQNQQQINQGFVEVSSVSKRVSKMMPEGNPVKAFSQSYGVLLHFSGGVSIEIYPDTNRDTIAWIVEMLRDLS